MVGSILHLIPSSSLSVMQHKAHSDNRKWLVYVQTHLLSRSHLEIACCAKARQQHPNLMGIVKLASSVPGAEQSALDCTFSRTFLLHKDNADDNCHIIFLLNFTNEKETTEIFSTIQKKLLRIYFVSDRKLLLSKQIRFLHIANTWKIR